MKYKKITKDDVYRILVNVALDISSPVSIINISNIASLLKTSRYQVKKYIDLMVKDGVAELKFEMIYDDEELYPPYWGYRLTPKGKDTDFYKNKDGENKKFFNLETEEDIDFNFKEDIF
jgi:hypothetical protein